VAGVNSHSRKRTVWLVQQGVWDMPKESMPLGVGYLKAAALEDDAIASEMDIRIFNFKGGDSVVGVAGMLFNEGVPDVIGFSVWGWNYRPFGHLAETYKQIRPDGWVVFGGNHVANQAERTFRHFPQVDVVVNSEGEFIFRALLHAYLQGRRVTDLADIPGISYRDEAGQVHTNPAPERIQDLDIVPSPFLTGAIPLTDEAGEFRYDVALMETNRGCPYRCAFCYWGGAIGQKVRAFSRDRLRAELEIFAFHRVHTIVLCDANFGMLKQDLEFVEDVIRTRERFGYPRAVESSWAKNKSKVFFEIVRRMKAAGMQSSFNLALQTLNDNALEQMQRRNMRLNDWEDLVHWLRAEGLDCYAELIWGAPGETYDTFLEGYDRLACYMQRIAPYQMLILPNTEYSNSREKFGFLTVRGEQDDFEYVLAHNTMTVSENLEMQRFLLWSRAIAEHLVLRHVWTPLRKLAGMTQSVVIRSLMDWVETSDHPSAVQLTQLRRRLGMQPSAVPTFMRQLCSDPAAGELFHGWWREAVEPMLPAQHAEFLTEVFRYDCVTRPVWDDPETGLVGGDDLQAVDVAGERYYHRGRVRFAYDVQALLRQLSATDGDDWSPRQRMTELSFYYKAGYYKYFANHEEAAYYPGRTWRELRDLTEAQSGVSQLPSAVNQ
jgi:radical SAM C-methyltransferase